MCLIFLIKIVCMCTCTCAYTVCMYICLFMHQLEIPKAVYMCKMKLVKVEYVFTFSSTSDACEWCYFLWALLESKIAGRDVPYTYRVCVWKLGSVFFRPCLRETGIEHSYLMFGRDVGNWRHWNAVMYLEGSPVLQCMPHITLLIDTYHIYYILILTCH